jgi:hypothetical protein
VTVTGVKPGASSTLTVVSSKTNHATSATQVVSSALNPAFLPIFGKAVRVAGGYKIQITNWRTGFDVTGVNSLGGAVTVSNQGLITVTGLIKGSSSTITITTARLGFVTGVRTTTVARAG